MEYEYRYDSRFAALKTMPVTIALVVVNVLVFLIMEMTGSTDDWDNLYRHGAMYVPSVINDGEYYRLLTSMFLHSGFEHILNNMVMLLILGYQIEKEYGCVKYFITYMVSGLCGSLLSGFIEMRIGEYSVGVGASGAIFGIFGVMLVMTFKNRKMEGQNNGPRLLILFALAVFGNMQAGVDWLAHLGGALAGVIIGFLWYRPYRKKENPW